MRKIFLFPVFVVLFSLGACSRTPNPVPEKAAATPQLEAIYDEVVPGMTVTQVAAVIQRYAPNAPINRFEQLDADILAIEWGTTDASGVSTMTRLTVVFQRDAAPPNNTVFEVDLEQEIIAKTYTGKTNRIKKLRTAQ